MPDEGDTRNFRILRGTKGRRRWPPEHQEYYDLLDEIWSRATDEERRAVLYLLRWLQPAVDSSPTPNLEVIQGGRKAGAPAKARKRTRKKEG